MRRLVPELLNRRLPPAAVVIDPPLITPPLSSQSPVEALSASTVPVLSRNPVRATVPPLRTRRGPVVEAVVNVPSRFSHELLMEIEPELVQLPWRVSVALLTPLTRAALVQVELDPPIVTVEGETAPSAMAVPALVKVDVLTLSDPPLIASSVPLF